MSSHLRTASERLNQVKEALVGPGRQEASSIPWNPHATSFPTRKELPKIDNAPDGAAWVWGKDDQLGRVNLLTPARVREAAKEIKTGEIVPVNLPLNVPETPAFHRKPFEHEIKVLAPDKAYDDLYHLNTQSGTQWDGCRHFSHLESGYFYNGVTGADIIGPNANLKDGIHHWSEHGLCGRGVLLDYASWAKSQNITFDPYTTHPISLQDLVETGKSQGIDVRPASQGGHIKPGDMLFVRIGWTQSYYSKTPEERHQLAVRRHEIGPDDGQRFAGLSQDEDMIDWLHDCYFASAAGDVPSLECWPSQKEHYLHEFLLARWGMPLGELFDLEKLAEKCREQKRWTFFFSSSPANCPGGVGSHVNGNAIL